MSTPEVEQPVAPSEPVEGAANLAAKAIMAAVAANSPVPDLPKPTPTATDPATALQNYPDTVSSEYVVKMRAAVDAALNEGDVEGLMAYATGINPEVGRPLMERARAYAGTLPPFVMSITGSATTDNAPANGTSANQLVFTAFDQNGQPIAAALNITSTGSAAADPASGTTAADGTLGVTMTDTVAERVIVTATAAGGTTNGIVASNFVEV